jgi:hypothetical protein
MAFEGDCEELFHHYFEQSQDYRRRIVWLLNRSWTYFCMRFRRPVVLAVDVKDCGTMEVWWYIVGMKASTIENE